MLEKRGTTLVLVVLLTFAPSLAFAARACVTGQVVETRGEVSRESPLQARVEKLKVGACIEDGVAVITRRNSMGKFHLNSPAALAIAPDSELLVGFPIGGKPTKLNLTRGEIRVKSEAKDESSSPYVTVLRMSLVAKTRDSEFLAEAFRDGQEGWIVVTKGQATVQVGGSGPPLVMSAGQSIYFTEEQRDLPRVVSLDEREMATLVQDKSFKQTISQLLMVEFGAEKEDEPHDLTLQEYADQEKAKEQEKLKAPIPKPAPSPTPTAASAPKFQQQAIEQGAAPLQVPLEIVPQSPQVQKQPVVIDLQLPPQNPRKAVQKAETPETPAASHPGVRLAAGPSFYSDTVGTEFSATLLTQAEKIFSSLNDRVGTGPFSLGAGLGYSHASKDNLDVNNLKLYALANYRVDLSRLFSVTPELDLGMGLEQVHTTLTTFASGLALYYSPRVILELNPQASTIHPGISAGMQEYVGATGLVSAFSELSLRIDF